MRVVVSLTTIPGREEQLGKTISSLLRQTRQPDAIYLWLPRERFDGNIGGIRFPGVDTRAGSDQGPAMKLLPTLAVETDPETAIITVDDDVEYPAQLVDKLVRASGRLPDHAIGFTGWSLVGGTPGSPVVAHMNEDVPESGFFQPVQVLEGTRGVLYRRRFFADDIHEHLRALDAFRYHDDILFAGYLASRGITRSVRWFSACPLERYNPWTVHCQDSGLHTTQDWHRLGWDCWDYWSTAQTDGIAPPLLTLSSADRLQLGAETCPRNGFIHHRLDPGVTEAAMAHPLEKIPWPWPDHRFEEVLALDVFSRPSLHLESCLAECRRILRPGGILVFRVPIAPPLRSSMEHTDALEMDVHTFCRLMRGPVTDVGGSPPSLAERLKDLRLSIERDGHRCTATLILPGAGSSPI